MRIRAVVLVCLFSPTLAWAGNFSDGAHGTTTAGFLKLGAGARAAAMGEAYSAIADEPSALYWNPAALTQVKRRAATLMHTAYVDSSSFEYGAYAQKMGQGVLGIGIQYFSAGRIVGTDATGTDTGSFTPNDLAVTLGYGYGWNGYSFGLSAKYVRSTIQTSAKTAAVDLGILTPLYFTDRLRLAVTATNFGGKMQFEQAKEDLPMSFRIGGALKFSDSWLAGMDGSFPRDSSPGLGFGLEHQRQLDALTVAVRAGFNTRLAADKDGLAGLSMGLGLTFSSIGFDYGIVPFGSLGLTHWISLRLII